MTSHIVVTDVESVRYIEFRRPDKLNALLRADLDAAVRAVEEANTTQGAVVFTGAGGRAFSAGMDVGVFMGLVDDPDQTRDVIGAVKHFLDTVRTAVVPSVCAVDGYCLGAAFELALACDLRVATPASTFGLPEMKLGLPCIMESALLPQYVGLARAKEIMLTGNIYTAEQMSAWGFLNAVVERESFESHVADVARGLANMSRAGMASQRRLFEVWLNSGFAAGSDTSIDEIDGVFHDPETKALVQGVAASLRSKTTA